MTVSTSQAFVEFTGDGTTVDFIFSFPSFETSWMNGFVDRVLVPTTTVLNEDQDLNPGGTMTFGTAPELDTVVLVLRAADFLQLTDYPPFTKFPARDHEDALDKLTMITQQLGHAILVLEGDATRFVLKAGDTMTGPLQTFDALIGPNDAVNRTFVDNEILVERDARLASDLFLQENKADKTVELVTEDPQTLIIADPSLVGDITITTRTNSQEALIKTNQVGLIPPEHIPPLSGGVITVIGLLDAGVDPTPDPPTVNETGQAYIIIGSGNLELFLFQDAVEQTVAVEITDNIVWVNGDNLPGLPEGWYFLPLSQVPTIGTAVILDDTLFPYVATNTQETFDRLFDTHLGTAATEDVQVGERDDAGVLITGSHGLGAGAGNEIIASTDADLDIKAGFYRYDGATVNAPTAQGFAAITLYRLGNAVAQMAIDTGASATAGTLYTRSNVSGVWGAWKLMVADGDSPTFSSVATTGNISCGNTLNVSGSINANGGIVDLVNPTTPSIILRIRANSNPDRQIMELSASTANTLNTIQIRGDLDTTPNRHQITVGGTIMIDVTATAPQCIDKAGTLRRMGWKTSSINVAAGDTLGENHIGHTVTWGTSGTLTLPVDLGENGDMIQLASRSAANMTINPTGGVILTRKGEGGGGTGAVNIGGNGVATLYRQSASAWYIWGAPLS